MAEGQGPSSASAENLARGQGGRDSLVEHAQEGRICAFLEKGEQILANFTSSAEVFQKTIETVSSLQKSVSTLQSQLMSRKRSSPDDLPGPATSKVPRVSSEVLPGTSGVNIADNDSSADDIDELFAGSPNSEPEDDGSDDLLAELEGFFAEESLTGEDIHERVAGVVNRALRVLPSHQNNDKMKRLREAHKRPANVANLQLPRIDKALWRELKHETRSVDVADQRAILNYNSAIVPIAKAMSLLCTKPHCSGDELRGLITDSFKLLCESVVSTNAARRAAVRKEVQPQYKEICAPDRPISTTNLFGDNMSEDLKALKEAKYMQITTNQSSSQKGPFLGKKWGGPAAQTIRSPHPQSGNAYVNNGIKKGPGRMSNPSSKKPKQWSGGSQGTQRPRFRKQ